MVFKAGQFRTATEKEVRARITALSEKPDWQQNKYEKKGKKGERERARPENAKEGRNFNRPSKQ